MEILVYSIFLQCNDLKNYCSGIVSNLITSQNALEILNIAELYNDLSLKRSCVQFISNNHDEFTDEDINQLSDDVKFKVKTKISQTAMKIG